MNAVNRFNNLVENKQSHTTSRCFAPAIELNCTGNDAWLTVYSGTMSTVITEPRARDDGDNVVVYSQKCTGCWVRFKLEVFEKLF